MRRIKELLRIIEKEAQSIGEEIGWASAISCEVNKEKIKASLKKIEKAKKNIFEILRQE